MVKFFISALALLFILNSNAIAQESDKDSVEGYQFTPVIEIPATSIKDQHRSGTCWSFSSLSFIESELIRMGKPALDLSEMFVVSHCYERKADKYVRMHGSTNFGAGGAFHDATWVIKNYGMVPESVYDGLTIGEDKPVHGEMDNALKGFVDGVIKNKNRKLSPVWFDTYKDILANYLGDIPETFEYEGVEYTPQSFARDYMEFNPDDYIEIGSYTHHPFYEPFVIEIPDNWLWDVIYNVPLEEMIEVIDNALANGYTIAWGADVSDKGFATKKKGVAVIPDVDITEMNDAEISKWESMDEKEQKEKLYALDGPGQEKTITQEMRQIDFDNYTSTDDHGMHIIGTAKDQNGTIYYKVKNSWGEYNDYEGYFYLSKPYVALRTIDIMVHKDALPKKIAKKLNLE
ncbi:MAG: aminopeptidase [Prolixibacteraceae bacterium]|jgi:bleomycin hydrolase|nr:aminopeptidase [Prolixibacteraceae bacterium]